MEPKTLDKEIDLQICSPPPRPEQICREMSPQMLVAEEGEGSDDDAKGRGKEIAELSEFLKIQQELFEKDHPHGLTATFQDEQNEKCQQEDNSSALRSTTSTAFSFSDPSASIANTASGPSTAREASPERRVKGSAGSEIKRFFGKVLSGMSAQASLWRGALRMR